jgi:glycosyltransferase involved in cell wall biosynthesis
MSQPISIVHLITGLGVGGAEITLHRLLANLDPGRFSSTVITLIPPGPVADMIRALGIPVTSLEMRRGAPSAGATVRLVSLLRRLQPAIVQTWLYHADLLGLAAGRMANVRRIVWNLRVSELDMRDYRPLSRWTVRACARLSSWPAAVVANSNAGRLYHQRIGYHPRRWVIIPNGVDTQSFRPDPEARTVFRRELGVATDMPLIGLAARFDPAKDHATFLRAAGKLASQEPVVHFVLVGEGCTEDNETLRALVEEQGLSGRVHLLGCLDAMPSVFAAWDIAALSSANEGFPNVVVEAMACGVPCVATAVGDVAEIMGDTGIVVPPHDAAALVLGWRALLTAGAARRQALGAAACARVEQHYSLSRMVQEYAELYDSLVS